MWPFPKKAAKSFSNTMPIEKWGGSYFYPVGSANTLFSDKTFEAFNKVPEVNAVLNYRASAKKNVVYRTVNKITGEDSTSPNARKVLKLLNNPNFFQDGKEFIRQSSLWHDITGNEYLYFQKPVGFKPINSKQIFTLPPQNVDIKLINEGAFFFITPEDVKINYTIKINNTDLLLPAENIVHLNDNRVNTSQANDNLLKGESKLKALSAPINNIIAAYEARNVFLVNRGALGILSNSSKDGIGGTAPLDEKEKGRLQEEFQKYGVQKNQWHTIITNMSLTWQQMSVDIDKLKVFEEVEEDFYKICDSFGVSKDLFSSKKGTTFNNQSSGERRFYESTIIPETLEKTGSLNQYFQTGKDTWEIRGDYSHLPIFSENIKERSQSLQTIVNALSKALEDGAISLEQYQAELQKFGI